MSQDPYVEIVDDLDVKPWQFVHPETKQVYASIFKLRVVSNTAQRKLRQKHTKVEFVRGSRNEVLDWAAFNDDCLDYAIVGWSGVRRQGVDLPCERKYKLVLPEIIKQEITRLTLGKELGQTYVEPELYGVPPDGYDQGLMPAVAETDGDPS